MARPSLVVEFAPGFTPFDDTPTWVDISSRVMSCSYTEGRKANLQAYPPGEATLVLGNEDRLFDPEYEAGAYSGQLVPRVPFRIRARSAGPTYRTLFYGFVEGGWEQDWRPPGDMVCTVTLVDWLGVIASYRVDDYLDDYVFAYDLIAWWRFDETRNTREVVDRSGNDHHGTAVGVTQGEAGLTPGAGRSIFVPRTDGGVRTAHVDVPVTAPLILAPPFSIAWVSKLNSIPDTGWQQHVVLQQYRESNNAGIGVFFNSWANIGGTSDGAGEHGLLTVVMNDGTARREIARSESGFDDGVARFFVWVAPTWDADDWVIRWSDEGSGTSESCATLVTNGGALLPVSTPDLTLLGNSDNSVGGDSGLNGQLDHVMLFDEALSTGDVNALNAAIWDYSGNQTTGAGIDWVLDRIGVPAAFRDIDTGDETMGVTTEFGALERMRGIEQVERGALYVDHEGGGVIRFRSASSLAADTRITTSQHTLSDEDTGGVFHYERKGLTIEANGVESIINRQTVEWAGGTVTVQDDDSVDAYGPRSGPTVAAPAEDYAQAKAIAEEIVLANKEPKTRVRSLSFDAGADDSNFDLLLDLQPRDMLTMERRPLGIGDPIEQDVYYQGGKYQIGPGLRWDGQLYLSTVPKVPVGAEVALRWHTVGPLAPLGFVAGQVTSHWASGVSNPFVFLPPAARDAGDLLMAFVEHRGGSDPTPDPDWTTIIPVAAGSFDTYAQRRTATDDAVDNLSSTHSSGVGPNGVILAFDTILGTVTTAANPQAAWGANNAQTMPRPTAPAAGWYIIVCIGYGTGSAAPTWTTPAGFTVVYDSGAVLPGGTPGTTRSAAKVFAKQVTAGLVPSTSVTMGNGNFSENAYGFGVVLSL